MTYPSHDRRAYRRSNTSWPSPSAVPKAALSATAHVLSFGSPHDFCASAQGINSVRLVAGSTAASLAIARARRITASDFHFFDLIELAYEATHHCETLAEQLGVLIDVRAEGLNAAPVCGDWTLLFWSTAQLLSSMVISCPAHKRVALSVSAMPGHYRLVVSGPGPEEDGDTTIHGEGAQCVGPCVRTTGCDKSNMKVVTEAVAHVVAAHRGQLAVLNTQGNGAQAQFTIAMPVKYHNVVRFPSGLRLVAFPS